MTYQVFLSETQQRYLNAALSRCSFDNTYEIAELLNYLTDAAWSDGHRSGFQDGFYDAQLTIDADKAPK